MLITWLNYEITLKNKIKDDSKLHFTEQSLSLANRISASEEIRAL
jgi:hypothetical protein